MNQTTAEPVHPYPHWKRRFFTIWSGQAVSMLGSSIVHFAIVWYLTEQTGSATVLAIASLFGVLPGVILSPFAGALVDRSNRRIVMIVADAVIGLTRLAGVFLFATGTIQVWHIYLMSLIGSAAGSFQHPAMVASTALMVPKKQLSRVAGMNQTLYGAVHIAAPPIGALLMSLTTISNMLLLDVFTMLLAVIPLCFIPIPQPPVRRVENGTVLKTTFFADLKEGFNYIITWPGLAMIILLAMAINFMLSPAMSLLPLLVSEHFGGSEVQLALLNSIMGIGMLVGGVVLSVWGGFKRRIFTSFAGLIGSGLAIIVVGLAPGYLFWLAAAGFALAMLMLPMINGPIQAVTQAAVAPEVQGRVFSLMSTGTQLAMPIGLMVAGPVSDAIGIQFWFILGGVVMGLSGLIGFITPALRNIEEQRQPAAEEPLPMTGAAQRVPAQIAEQK
jgi:DHA3 family macrolide efflux protein-like MFS transporter